ncbi:MAG: T9SS type A sorting domain-containing protein [Bacteroidales bacterium]|nr:T9SS type A sorting domain-containing protein [Bacteroidales bacterium]
MKKVVTLMVVCTMFASLSAESRKWQGSQEAKKWDYVTPNWLNPALPLPIPTSFAEGSKAYFDDSILRESDTLSVSGVVVSDSVFVNATKRYVIRRTADTDSLMGDGALVKDGTGLLVMDVKSALKGGTILKGGMMRMEKQTTPNIWGSKIVFMGGAANFATSSSSSYPTVSVPVEIPAGQTAVVELSRYSYWNSKLTGAGNLHIYAGGERTYLGKARVAVDWSEFTGNVKVEKYVMDGVNPGFYGLILNTEKTFLDSLDGYKIDSTFYNKKLELGEGVCITSESGTRAYAIGELTGNDTLSVIAGYYKKSTTPIIKYFIGGLNTDVDLYAQFNDPPGTTTGYNKVGFVKVGTGTYRLLNNNNNIIGGLEVRAGTVLADDKVLWGNVRGSVGNNTVVWPQGTLGGKGRIQGNVDLQGKLTPGSKGTGTLMITDSLSRIDGAIGTRNFNLTCQPGSTLEFEIGSLSAYDKVIVSGTVKMNTDENQVLPGAVVKLVPAAGASINDNEQFILMEADTISASEGSYSVVAEGFNNVDWSVELVHTAEPRNSKMVATAKVKTGLNPVTAKEVTMGPNPATSSISLQSPVEIASIEILNLQGQIIHRQQVGQNSLTTSVDFLQPGVYYLRLNKVNGSEVHKLMKR